MKNVIFFIIVSMLAVERLASSLHTNQHNHNPVFNFEAKICEVQELKIGVRIGPKYP